MKSDLLIHFCYKFRLVVAPVEAFNPDQRFGFFPLGSSWEPSRKFLLSDFKMNTYNYHEVLSNEAILGMIFGGLGGEITQDGGSEFAKNAQ